MKKICTSNRIGTVARRDGGTRTAKALSLQAGNGKSHGIHVPGADFHSDSRWLPEATRNPLTANASVLEDLAGALGQITPADHPRTFKLLQSSRHKLTRKLIEEACEVTKCSLCYVCIGKFAGCMSGTDLASAFPAGV